MGLSIYPIQTLLSIADVLRVLLPYIDHFRSSIYKVHCVIIQIVPKYRFNIEPRAGNFIRSHVINLYV